MDIFDSLGPVDPKEMIGLWKGRSVPSGHPFDGVLEILGWFGKRFTANARADALLFRAGNRRLIPVDPAFIPLGLALRLHRLGRTRAAANLFSYLAGRLRAKGPVASLRTLVFRGVSSAAMVYDAQPITDHFRRLDEDRLMGAMTITKDERIFFFELERVEEAQDHSAF